jgi:hypothetical protein
MHRRGRCMSEQTQKDKAVEAAAQVTTDLAAKK